MSAGSKAEERAGRIRRGVQAAARAERAAARHPSEEGWSTDSDYDVTLGEWLARELAAAMAGVQEESSEASSAEQNSQTDEAGQAEPPEQEVLAGGRAWRGSERREA